MNEFKATAKFEQAMLNEKIKGFVQTVEDYKQQLAETHEALIKTQEEAAEQRESFLFAQNEKPKLLF